MIGNAFALATVTTGGFIIIYQKLPRRVRKFMEKHQLMTDLAACIAVYAFLGGTLTALMAGAIVGVYVSILLKIAENKEDFLYLYDLRDWVRENLRAAKDMLNDYGKKYREKKHPEPVTADA